MATPWSATAKTQILSGGCRLEPRVYIDVEQNGAGTYGVNVVDISVYVLNISRIERTTSAYDENWELKPCTITVKNESAYFTPNLMSGGRDQVSNIWQTRPSGEADFRDCRVYVKMKVWLSDGTTEEVMIYRGKILNLNFQIADRDAVCELETRDDFLDCLDTELDPDLGGKAHDPYGDGVPEP